MQWSDVQWEERRLRIQSTKTGLRFCPIFPQLRPLLDAAWDTADEGARYVISRYRQRETNLRTQLGRIIERAGLVPWAKPFVNLRASCRTDLEERFPSHVVDAWLGHSTRVARKHYLQVTEAHWDRAVKEDDESGGPTGGPIHAHTQPSTGKDAHEKPSKTLVGVAGHSEEFPDRHPRQDSNLRPHD